jgi:hypothetical protein
MRTFMSYVGLLLLAIALMLLGADMVTSLENHDQITLRSFQMVWAMFDSGSVTAFIAWMSKTLPAFVTSAVLTILAIPAWSLGFIGVIITFVTGHKREAA